MPRTPTRAPAAPTAELAKINAFIASAAHLTKDNMARPKTTGGSTEWQNEAWYFYDTVGEFRFGANWKAQALSRCRLVIQTLGAEGTWVTEKNLDCPEWQALRMLFGGDSGQAQAMATMGLHIDVAGETYVVGETLDEQGRPDPNGTDTWTVYSNEEFRPKGTTEGLWELDRGDGKKRTITEGTGPGQAWVIRIWRSHPRKWVEADSPARASLPILRQIENLTKKIAAEIDSRLAGAGVLFVPTEMTFSGAAGVTAGQVNTEGEDNPAPLPVVDLAAQQKAADKFLTDLLEAMTLPIANRDHPSSVVPVVVQAPAVYLDKVKHLEFSKALDEQTLATRTEEIRRLALTADMPAEIMLGLGDVNHWTAWQLDESAIKMHVEPNAEVVTSGFTEQWLPTAVKALGGTPDPRRRVGVDTTDLRLRPDRTAQAQWLYEHFELDGESLRRELGIEGDAPTPEELRGALLRKLMEGVITPDIVLAALAALGVDLDVKPIESRTGLAPGEVVPKGDKVVPKELPGPPPADGPPPTDAPPPAQAASAGHTPAEAAVFAAAELLVERAVERAHNRARQRGKHRGRPTAEQLDADLHGAWDSAARTAAHLGVDPEWFTERLDTYARGLLTTGEDHQPQVLSRVLGS